MTTKEKKAWSAAAAIGTVMVVILSQMGETPEPPVRLNHMNRAQKDSVVAKEIREAKIGDEIVSLRTKTARITKVGSNKFNARITSAPQNYLDDADSVYKPIDLAVKDVSDLAKDDPLRKFDKYINAGNFRAGWKKNKRHDVSFYRENSFISYTALFDTIDVPVTTKFSTVGVKQTYTFADVESVQDLKWLMSSNTIKQKRPDGGFNFYSDDYSLQFIMPAPTAWDANHVFIPVTATISGDTLIYVAVISEDVVFPVTIDPTTVITTNDAYIYVTNGTYVTARDAVTGDAVYTTILGVGQITDFTVMRNFFSFAIPDMTTLTSASLFLEGNSDNSTTDFEIYIHAATQSTPLVKEDFDLFDGHQASGAYNGTPLTDAWSSADFSPEWNEYIFNNDGLAAIFAKKNDIFKIVAISEEDYNSSAPVANEYVTFETSATADKEPYLSITFLLVPNAPTNFANTSATTMTLSYSWTDNSGDELGFKIKNAGGDTVTVGTYDAEAEVGTVEGLGVNTRHGLRVFAFNADGWSTPSDSVVTYTLANPPELWDFTNIGATGTVDVGFGENGNPATTEYAVRDSTGQKWIQTDGTRGETIAWATYAVWDAVTITEPGTTGTIRYSVMARNGDNVNTAEITGTLDVYKYPPCTSFALSNPDTTSIDAAWTLDGVHVDSLLIMNSPENTAVQYVSVAKEDTTVGGLTPNTLYTFFIRADSAGTKGDSNADSLYTLAAPPIAWDFTEDSPLELTPSFSGGSNPAGTQYAIRDSLRHVWIDAAGVPIGTKTWRTEAQWEAITLTGLMYDQQYLLGVVAKNYDDIETTYLWGTVTTGALTTTIQAIEDGGLVSIPQTSNYALFNTVDPWYGWTDSTSYASRNYQFSEYTGQASFTVGEHLTSGTYYTYRSYVRFNTESIPDDAIIDSVKVKFKLTDKKSISSGDSLYLLRSSGFTPVDKKQWFSRFYTWYPSGAYPTANLTKLAPGESLYSLSNGDSTNIYYKFNAAGLAIVNKTGYTEMFLLTEMDRAGLPPSSDQYVTLDVDYCYMQVYYNPYAYSRNVATGTVIDTLKVGQDSLSVSRDVIDRSFMTFPMPAGMTSVTTATLKLYGYADSSATDFEIYVVGANAYRPTLTTADFIRFHGRQTLNTPHTSTLLNDTWSSSSWTAGWVTITLNSDGIDSLEAASGDSLALALISKNDFDATAPTGAENIMFYTATESGKEPFLDLSYALTKPSNFTIDPESSTRLILTWTDNTDDEDGFRIIDPFTYAYMDSADADSTYKVLTGLDVNTLYRFRVQVIRGASDFEVSDADSGYTLPVITGAPTVSNPTNTTLKAVIDTTGTGNPSYTKYLLMLYTAAGDTYAADYSGDSLQVFNPFFVNADSLNSLIDDSHHWGTYVAHGSTTGTTFTVEPGRTFTGKVFAKSGQ